MVQIVSPENCNIVACSFSTISAYLMERTIFAILCNFCSVACICYILVELLSLTHLYVR